MSYTQEISPIKVSATREGVEAVSFLRLDNALVGIFEMKKKCTECGEWKSILFFNKHPHGKYKRNSICKKCQKKKFFEYSHSKDGFIRVALGNQIHSSKLRGHPMPSYTIRELREWALSQKTFHELFIKWEASGYDNEKTPSFDRIDDYKPYTLDNLQLTTWLGNRDNYYSAVMCGKNTKQCKAVLQFDLDGNFIKRYHSVSAAARHLNGNTTNISGCCIGYKKSAYGFIWKHEK